MDGFDADCLIVGGGAGGLAAATYLARFRRRVVVVDAGESRLRWIRVSHNVPGYPDGIAGPVLLDRLKTQAARYGVRLESGRIERLAAVDGGFAAGGLRVRRAILATGVRDVLPAIEGLSAAIVASAVRLCPVCDAYEVTGRRVGILGPPDRALREAAFLAAYTDRLTLLRAADHPAPTPAETAAAAAAGLRVAAAPVLSLAGAAGAVTAGLADGRRLDFDGLYLATGIRPRSDLATAAGAGLGAGGYLEVDAHQRLVLPGLHAVGDVVHELNQIAVAWGHAAIAATDVHNALSAAERAQQSET